MAERTTQVIPQVEYVPPHKARTTQIVPQVEYVPPHKARTTQIVVMVEYWETPTPPATGRKYGPAVGNG